MAMRSLVYAGMLSLLFVPTYAQDSDSESISPPQLPIAASDSESISPAQLPVAASDSESESPINVPPPAVDSDSESTSPPTLPSPLATASPSAAPKTPFPVPPTIPPGGLPAGAAFGEIFVWTIPTLDPSVPLPFVFDCTGAPLTGPSTYTLLEFQNSVGDACSAVTITYVNCDAFSIPPPTCNINSAGAGNIQITLFPNVSPSMSASPQTPSPSRSPQTPSGSRSPVSRSPVPSRASRRSPNRYSRAISRASKGAEYKSRPAGVSRMMKNSPYRKPEKRGGDDHGKDNRDNEKGRNDKDRNDNEKSRNDNEKSRDDKKDDRKDRDRKNGGQEKEEKKKKDKKDREAVDAASAVASDYTAPASDSSNGAYYALLAIIPVAIVAAGFVWWRARRPAPETATLEYFPKV